MIRLTRIQARALLDVARAETVLTHSMRAFYAALSANAGLTDGTDAMQVILQNVGILVRERTSEADLLLCELDDAA